MSMTASAGRRVTRRLGDVADWALLYPRYFGVAPERVHTNELSLIDVAFERQSLITA